jgi:prevent-host-death family protein
MSVMDDLLRVDTNAMRTMTASEFCARCLDVIDEVHASGDSVLITKNGKPYVVLEPVNEQSTAEPGKRFGGPE